MAHHTTQRLSRAFILVMLGSIMLASPAQAQSRVSIAAIVGDDVITTSDVGQRRDLLLATAGIPMTVENQEKITPRIIQSLIDETLQLQEAKKNSLIVTDEEVSKAIDEMGARGNSNENIRDFIKRQGLSQRSFENQVRAQLAWGKVVQRKLRRNVSISQDEVQRAQKSEAAAPGELELRLSALELTVASKEKEESMVKLADEIALQMKTGADMASVAARYIRQPEVQFKPPVWVPEKNLPPALQQAMRSLKEGESTPPLRGPKTIQILQVLERKTAPKQDESTEYAIKQISIAVPKKRDKASLTKLREVASTLRTNPGDCMSEAIPKVELPAAASFVRTRVGALLPELRSIIGHLEVGDISEPIMTPEALRLVMVCEIVEPSSGNLPNAEKIRQALFAEKLELEAQKHLRNLRRDAFIDIKGAK